MAAEVRSEARRLGLSPRLRRLTAEGLLAAPRGTGRGRGRGRRYSYPARALDQLGDIAEAARHRRRYAALRHEIWWSRGGRLEDWELWQRDRLVDLAVQISAWDMPPAVDDELPAARLQHIVDVAERLRTSRVKGLSSTRLNEADTQTYVRVFTSVILRDDLLNPPDEPSSDDWASVRELAAKPVDRVLDESVGGSLGALFESGSGWSHPGVSRGAAALACAHYVPAPGLAAAILLAMSEERATVLRDAVIAWATLNGKAELLIEHPLFAVQALLTWELLASTDHRALEEPTAAA